MYLTARSQKEKYPPSEREIYRQIGDQTDYVIELLEESKPQKIKRRGDEISCRCPSPQHEDKNPSCSINVSEPSTPFLCRSCGLKGNLAKLVETVKGCDYNEAKKLICERNNIIQEPQSTDTEILKVKIQKPKVIERPDFNHIAKMYHEFLYTQKDGREMKQFLNDHLGLNDDLIDELQIGYCSSRERVSIPISDENSDVVNIRLRSHDPISREKYGKVINHTAGHGENRLYPIKAVLEPVIYLVEGELDALIGRSIGLNTLTQTAGCKSWKKEFSEKLRDKTVIICYDNDTAGKEGTKQVIAALNGVAHAVGVIHLPDDPECNDLSDFVLKKGYTKESFDKLITWIPPMGLIGCYTLKNGEIAEVRNDGIYVEKKSPKGKKNEEPKLVSNLYFRIVERRYSPDTKHSIFVLNVYCDGRWREIEVNGATWADDRRLKEAIVSQIHGIPVIDSGNTMVILKLLAADHFSPAMETMCFSTPGFQSDKSWRSSSVSVVNGQITFESNRFMIDSNSKAAKIDLKGTEKECAQVIHHLFNEFVKLCSPETFWVLLLYTISCAVVKVFGNLVSQRFFAMITGGTGFGKSELALFFQSFFGDFLMQGDTLSWESTPNAIAAMCAEFGGALAMIDDLKEEVLGSEQTKRRATQILQSFATGNGRDRCQADGQVIAGNQMNCGVVIPAEDALTGQASIKGRSIEVSHDGSYHNCEAYSKSVSMRPINQAMMLYFIAHLQRLSSDPNRSSQIISSMAKYREELSSKKWNARLRENISLLMVCRDLLMEFAAIHVGAIDCDKLLKASRSALESVAESQQGTFEEERIGIRFLNAIHACEKRIAEKKCNYANGNYGPNFIGFYHESELYLHPRKSEHAVREYLRTEGREWHGSITAIAADLKQLGLLEFEQKRHTKRVLVKESQVHMWVFKTREPWCQG